MDFGFPAMLSILCMQSEGVFEILMVCLLHELGHGVAMALSWNSDADKYNSIADVATAIHLPEWSFCEFAVCILAEGDRNRDVTFIDGML